MHGHPIITVVLPLILHVHACRRCAIKPSNNRVLLRKSYLGHYNVGQDKVQKKAKLSTARGSCTLLHAGQAELKLSHEARFSLHSIQPADNSDLHVTFVLLD